MDLVTHVRYNDDENNLTRLKIIMNILYIYYCAMEVIPGWDMERRDWKNRRPNWKVWWT